MIRPKVCAVCSWPLNLLMPTCSWIHADPSDDDHPPVAVDATDTSPRFHRDARDPGPAAGTLPSHPSVTRGPWPPAAREDHERAAFGALRTLIPTQRTPIL